MRKPVNDTDLDRAIEVLKGLRVGMTDASRRHMALKCRQPRVSAWESLARQLEGLRLHRIPLAAGAMALLLAVFLAAFLVGDGTQPGLPGPGGGEVRLVNVVPAATGGVTLEWRDGPKRSYTVLKTTDPRKFTSAESYAVRGTRWTDPAPSAGEVVYYRVE